MDVELDKLTVAGREAYETVDAALLNEIGRRLPSDTTPQLRRTAAFIAVQAMSAQLGRWRAEHARKDTVDQVAEQLFDVAHENCDEDECTAGGMWAWQDIARRLIDSVGPLVAVAFEQTLLRDDLGDPAAEAGEDGWLPTLQARLVDVGRAHEVEQSDRVDAVRRELIRLGAWTAEWIADLDRARDAEVARLVADHG